MKSIELIVCGFFAFIGLVVVTNATADLIMRLLDGKSSQGEDQ